jgi:hypothetical protein
VQRRRFASDAVEPLAVDGPETGELAGPIGLSEAEAREFLAVCAAAERSAQPDRLPLAIGLALLFLVGLAASGLPQRMWIEARERGIERLVHRPDLKRGWTARVGATREDLGLQPRPAHIAPVKPAWQLW